MKKLYILAAVALLTFGMVSCNKDDNTGDNQNTPTNPTNPTNPSNPGTDPGTANPWENPNPGTTSGEWVDLGLSVQWYSVNIGAAAPEHYGNYYAWGEIQTRDLYTWNTYPYGDRDSARNSCTMNRYNTHESAGTVDNKTVLEASDDVATVVLGSMARIPTKSEWEELLNNTTAENITVNSVSGRRLTAANGNSIFLPYAGHRVGLGFSRVGCGAYWTASLYQSNPASAWEADLYGSLFGITSFERCYGNSVRAVRSAGQN